MTNETNRKITLSSPQTGIKPVILDGCTTEELFNRQLGYVPSAEQLRINGAEFMGAVGALELNDGDLVVVLDAAVADKGIAGA